MGGIPIVQVFGSGGQQLFQLGAQIRF